VNLPTITSHATSQPLPDPLKPKAEQPSEWVGGPLVTSTVTTQHRGAFDRIKTTTDTDQGFPIVAYHGGKAFTPVSHKPVDAKLAKSGVDRDRIAFAKLGAVSFTDAVKAAAREARYITSVTGNPAGTVGVLQARDGAYYVAPLGGYVATGARIFQLQAPADTDRDTHTIDIQRATDDLKAIVGVSRWVNFTSEQVDLDLSQVR
jgi:hypothetical protein